MTRNEFKTENSGENQGVIVGQNSGNINVSIQKVVKIPSLIATVVKTLGEMCVQDDFSDNIGNLQEYRPDEKIEYNCVVKYKMCSSLVFTSKRRNNCRKYTDG